MKKLLYTFLAVSIIFSACKKEDDSPNSGRNSGSNNTSGSIIGTWKIIDKTSTITTGYIDPVFLTDQIHAPKLQLEPTLRHHCIPSQK